MAETETRIALLEQGKAQIMTDISELKQDVKEIKSMLINNLVNQKDFQEYKNAIRKDMESMHQDYVDRLAGYKRSQFWQKVMTVLGTLGLSVLGWIIIYELAKLIEK